MDFVKKAAESVKGNSGAGKEQSAQGGAEQPDYVDKGKPPPPPPPHHLPARTLTRARSVRLCLEKVGPEPQPRPAGEDYRRRAQRLRKGHGVSRRGGAGARARGCVLTGAAATRSTPKSPTRPLAVCSGWRVTASRYGGCMRATPSSRRHGRRMHAHARARHPQPTGARTAGRGRHEYKGPLFCCCVVLCPVTPARPHLPWASRGERGKATTARAQ